MQLFCIVAYPYIFVSEKTMLWFCTLPLFNMFSFNGVNVQQFIIQWTTKQIIKKWFIEKIKTKLNNRNKTKQQIKTSTNIFIFHLCFVLKLFNLLFDIKCSSDFDIACDFKLHLSHLTGLTLGFGHYLQLSCVIHLLYY